MAIFGSFLRQVVGFWQAPDFSSKNSPRTHHETTLGQVFHGEHVFRTFRTLGSVPGSEIWLKQVHSRAKLLQIKTVCGQTIHCFVLSVLCSRSKALCRDLHGRNVRAQAFTRNKDLQRKQETEQKLCKDWAKSWLLRTRGVFFYGNTSQWCSLSLSAGGCCWRTGRSEHPPVNFFHSFYSTARKAIRFVKTKHKTNWELVSKKHLFCVYVFTRAWTFFDQFSVSRRSCSVPTTSKTCFSWKTGSSGVLGGVLESFGADIGSLPKSHNLA